MHFVEIELACEGCAGQGVERVLGAWAVETHGPDFQPDHVFEKGDNRAAELREIIEADGTLRRRYRLKCPQCGSAPQIRRRGYSPPSRPSTSKEPVR